MQTFANHCAGCPLENKFEPFDGFGDIDHARFLVVTGIPQQDRVMNPKAMKLLTDCFSDQGFERSDFYFYPGIRCHYDPDLLTSAEKRDVAAHCRNYYLEVQEDMHPIAVVPLGADAASQVTGKAVKITKVRGQPTTLATDATITVLPTINPIQAVWYPQHVPTLQADIATLGRLVDNGYDVDRASRSVLGEYSYIDDLQFLIDQRPPIVAFDTENTGLRWFQQGCDVRTFRREVHGKDFAPRFQILTMQFCIEPGRAYMLPWDHPDAPMPGRKKVKLVKQLQQLLCNPDVTLVVGQNLKYDALALWSQTGLRFRIAGDTLNMAALLDENSLAKNQDELVRRYVPEMAGYADTFNATIDKSRMWEVPLGQDLLDYGCGDADSCFRLHEVMYAQICEDEKLLAHYEHVTLPGLNAFTSMETRGQPIDDQRIDEFEATMAEEIERQYASLLKQVPRSIKRAHVEKGLKFSRREFVQDILFSHPDGFRLTPRVFTKGTAKLADPRRRVPSVSSKDHLPYFFDSCEFTFELAEYVKQERILSTNVRGFRKKYITDGLVRPIYSLHKAVTGRSASEDPNGQNYPKRGKVAKAYRSLFVPPPGMLYLENDLSQAELRIAGDMANDPTMIKIYRNEGDIHTFTALIVMQVDMDQFVLLPKEEQKAARTKAKAVNFGFLYGMGWRKFIAYAKTQYGVEFSEREAKRIRAEFFERYPQLPAWHAAMRRFAVENGFVRSYSGRIRHLPMIDSTEDWVRAEAERQAINSPVQEFGSSLGVMALGRMNEEVDEQYLPIVGFVHDAIYAFAHPEYAEWSFKTLAYYMESNPLREWFDRRMKIPIVADASLGVNLGDMQELGKFDRCNDKGECEVNTYDFDALWKPDPKTGKTKPGFVVPRQKIPPRNGRVTKSTSVYTFV